MFCPLKEEGEVEGPLKEEGEVKGDGLNHLRNTESSLHSSEQF